MAYISKAEFVAQLGELLKNANLNVTGLELSEDENRVRIHFSSGYSKLVDITADSYGAIVLDVTRGAY